MEEKEAETTTALVAISNHGKVLNNSALVRNSEWIIDSSATSHMTFHTLNFLSCHSTLGKCHITVAYTSRTLVASSGTVALHPSLYLHDMFMFLSFLITLSLSIILLKKTIVR